MPNHVVRGLIISAGVLALTIMLFHFQINVREQIASAVNAALTTAQGARL